MRDYPLSFSPVVTHVPGNVQGTRAITRGYILHATRSNTDKTQEQEFAGTIQFVKDGALDGEGTPLGWNATVGPGKVCTHMKASEWGWNARGHSREYVAIEVAQSKLDGLISDDTWDSVVWFVQQNSQVPHVFVMHSDLPAGVLDGKTDITRHGEGQQIINMLLEKLNAT